MPFVLDIFLQMDNCSGTNKSQYVFGGLALLLSVGLLDVIRPRFMIAGHTKFGPDVVAQKVAGRFNKADVFNHAMLNECCAPFAEVKGYDGSAMLRTWRECTPAIFKEVQQINSYRLFTLVRDDGQLNLGEGQAKSSTDAKNFPGNGKVFKQSDLQAAIVLLKKRSAARVLREVRAGTYSGVGSGRGAFGPPRAQLVPPSVQQAYVVRLFVKAEEQGEYWMEQSGYTKHSPADITAAVNLSLTKVVPYASSTAVNQQAREVIGPRAAQVKEQFDKWVQPQYVPIRYELSYPPKTQVPYLDCELLVNGILHIHDVRVATRPPPVPASSSRTAARAAPRPTGSTAARPPRRSLGFKPAPSPTSASVRASTTSSRSSARARLLSARAATHSRPSADPPAFSPE
jgi:hypothetical protein